MNMVLITQPFLQYHVSCASRNSLQMTTVSRSHAHSRQHTHTHAHTHTHSLPLGNGDVHNYSLIDLEVCKPAAPSTLQSGPIVASASSNLDSARLALFDDSDETFWETDGNKPHWVEIELPRQFSLFQVSG